MREVRLRWYADTFRRDEESHSGTLWNEEIGRRCVVVDITEKVRELRLK